MKSILVAFLAARALAAQSSTVEAVGFDAVGRMLRVEARDCTALDLLTLAAGAAGAPMKVAPEVVDQLARRTVTVLRERIVLEDLALLVCEKVGVAVGFEDGRLALAPALDGRDQKVRRALGHVERSLLSRPDPQLLPALRFERACLLLESGAAGEAAAAFTDLVREFPGDAARAEASVLAIAAALRAGRSEEALAALGTLEESGGGIPSIPGAELLPARVHAAAGNLQEALVRARKVAKGGRFARDRVLAGLLTAEIEQSLADGEGMLAALRELPADVGRSFRDLAPKIELATGVALALMHRHREALVHYRIALRTIEAPLKASVACKMAESLATLGEEMPAWLALRQAEALETDAARARAIRARRAGIEEAFGATSRAAETCASILREASGPFPESEVVLATFARCMLANDEVEDARGSLETLSDQGEYRGWALYQLARMERRCGDPERALRALARIQPADLKPPGPSPEQVRSLRGDLLIEIGDPLQAAEVFRGREEVSR